MNLYLDTSALIKRYSIEPGSTDVQRLVQQSTLLATARITRAEMSAAFARAVRMGVLSRPQALRNLSRFQQDWFDLFRIDVSEALVAQADALAWLHTLRGYDAIHLAAALAWQNELGEPVAIATYDQQLWTASNEARLIVYPPQL